MMIYYDVFEYKQKKCLVKLLNVHNENKEKYDDI